LIERLLLEARAQARIEHENVCKVFEAGEIDGKRYIAMQYVRGGSLFEMRGDMTMEQQILALRKVADAVHAAHRVGIIHRDLKPANILAEKNEKGEWVPFVMDFGLARDLSAPGLTRTGVIVGSALYMAPEQAIASGAQPDRRSDVYSLGVTMYQVLTSKLPMDGDTEVEVLIKTLRDEPVPMRKRNRRIPRDIETIVMRCLEKEPERRYESARALAEDLERYLNGESILAQPVGLARSMYRKVRKHKAVTVAAALALALTLIFLWISWNAKQRAEQQVMAARQFGQQVQQIESLMRIAHMLPLHDTRREMQIARARSQDISRRMQSLGPPGFGPGEYALGRYYLALKDYPQARQHLETAWNSGYGEAEVAYALGLALGEIYQRKLKAALRLGNQVIRERQIKQIEQNELKAALQHLTAGKGAWAEAPDYGEALLALYRKDYPGALSKARDALNAAPWLYEAKKLQGDVYFFTGNNKMNRGQLDAAADDFETSGRLYREASEIAHSDASIYISDCQRLNQMLALKAQRGTDAPRDYGLAEEACGRALTANPENGEALASKSWIYIRWAESTSNFGQDPRPLLGKSILLSSDALRWNPAEADAYEALGMSFWLQGAYERDHGIDPRSALNQAIEYSEKLIKLSPNYVWAHNTSGLAFWTKSSYEMIHGIDPRNSLRSAISQFERAIKTAPDYMWPYTNMGNAYSHLAHYEIMKGIDPRENLDRAIASYRKALDLNPAFSFGFNNLGSAYHFRAIYEISQGFNPIDSLKQAAAGYRKAYQLKPDYVWPYNNLAQVCALEAVALMEAGKDPSPALSAGQEAISNALKINQTDSLIHQSAAEVWIAAARWEMRRERRAVESFTGAERSLHKALRLDPQNVEALMDMAQLWRLKAEWMISQDASAAAAIDSGIEYARRAARVDNELAEAAALRGRLLLLKAKQAGSPTAVAKEAEASLEAALRSNKNLQREYGPFLEQARRLASPGGTL
jgi:serine/threonine-protein kinase